MTTTPFSINDFVQGSPFLVWSLLGGLTAAISYHLLSGSSDSHIVDLGGLPTTTAWNFFSKRDDFMKASFRRSGGLPFRFRILHYRVIAVSGPVARRIFFNDPSLDLEDGYRMLVGGPKMEDINVETEVLEKMSRVLKRFHLLLGKERLTDLTPVFLSEIHQKSLAWGKEGTFNPFQKIHEVIFQLTVRMSTCQELSQNNEAIRKLIECFWQMERSATPTRLLLPWMPSRAKRANEKATMGLYLNVLEYVLARRAAGGGTNDPIDLLLQNGDSDNDIVEMVIALIFTGFTNAGVNTCWALLHLVAHPHWRAAATSEFEMLLTKYASHYSSDQPLHKRLSLIPYTAWDSELPTLDLVIRETVRISHNITSPRRNLGKDMVIQGATIKTGEFLLFDFTKVQMNPDVYKDPEGFDPARYMKGREEDKKDPLGFIGWGAGRHPCAGMKVAQLEIKLVLAALLLGFEFVLVDRDGLPTNLLPKQDRNDIHQSRPLEPVYLKYRRVRE